MGWKAARGSNIGTSFPSNWEDIPCSLTYSCVRVCQLPQRPHNRHYPPFQISCGKDSVFHFGLSQPVFTHAWKLHVVWQKEVPCQNRWALVTQKSDPERHAQAFDTDSHEQVGPCRILPESQGGRYLYRTMDCSICLTTSASSMSSPDLMTPPFFLPKASKKGWLVSQSFSEE